jgi:hypothetical protein
MAGLDRCGKSRLPPGFDPTDLTARNESLCRRATNKERTVQTPSASIDRIACRLVAVVRAYVRSRFVVRKTLRKILVVQGWTRNCIVHLNQTTICHLYLFNDTLNNLAYIH